MKQEQKIIYVENSLMADSQTGEVISAKSKKVVKIPQEPDYVKLYLNAVMYISDMPEGISSVMSSILKRMPFADKKQKVVLTKSIKQDIAEELNVSESYVRKSIALLTKGNMILHTGSVRSCCYIINPHIFGRGEWKDIEELQLHIKFNHKGKSFWTEIKKSEQSTSDLLEKKSNEDYLKHV